MGMNIYGKTDVGLKRETNQDCFVIENITESVILMIVCDGMGGANGGSEASSLAAKSFSDYVRENFENTDEYEYTVLLTKALERANERVLEKASSGKEYEGMGTTLVCALYDGESYNCLWVGDSRIYAFRTEGVVQISHDHSFVQSLVDSGNITTEEAKIHPNRNIITKAVGIENGVAGDVCRLSSQEFDGLLLCTDGLCGYVEEKDIYEALRTKKDASECCEKLIELANKSGGNDNITVIVHKKQ